MLSLDLQNKGTVAFNKFQIESKDVGITLSPDDFKSLLILFEVKDHFDHRRNQSHIDYNKAIKCIIPVLTKNSDVKVGKNFSIRWSISQNAKTRVMIAKKEMINLEQQLLRKSPAKGFQRMRAAQREIKYAQQNDPLNEINEENEKQIYDIPGNDQN